MLRYIKITYLFRIFVFGLMFCSQVSSVNAQLLHARDVILQPSELLAPPSTEKGNSTFSNQEGYRNNISIIQEQTEGALLENIAQVLQIGRENLANIVQEGSGNQLVLIQDGNLNIYELIADGDNIQIAIVQEGRRNKIIQNITDSSNIFVEFEQRGNDNSITHEVEGLSNRDYIIRQIGDGMSVIVRQSGY